jgi:hypothetical protein
VDFGFAKTLPGTEVNPKEVEATPKTITSENTATTLTILLPKFKYR